MNNIQQLIELGGASMIAILAISILVLAVIIYKIIQLTTSGYWQLKSPTRDDIIKAQSGLRTLEISATIAPLLGLLGTVLGMISAFQSLEVAGGTADMAILAGGIWQALSTTAAGMVVSILATTFLGLFDGVAERLAFAYEAVK